MLGYFCFYPCPKENLNPGQAACDHLKDIQDYQRGSRPKVK